MEKPTTDESAAVALLPTRTYTIAYERIGRRRDVAPLVVERPASIDALTEAVYRHAGRYLMSRDYEVDVFVEEDGTGKVYVDGGRFGEGVIAPS